MGQDTACSSASGPACILRFNGIRRVTRRRNYNAMMRKFCRIREAVRPVEPCTSSLARHLETTVTQALGKTYESFTSPDVSASGPGSADCGGYTGTCAQCTRRTRRARRGAGQTRRLISGGTACLVSIIQPSTQSMRQTVQKFILLEIGPRRPTP